MKISLRGMTLKFKRWISSLEIVPRWVLLKRTDNGVLFSIFKKQKGEWLLERSGEGELAQALFGFPRVFGIHIAALIPLAKAQILEFKTPLRDKKQVLKVLPFEMASSLPYPTDQAVFDCTLAREEKGELVWNVYCLQKKTLNEEIDFWKEKELYLDSVQWEGALQTSYLKEKALESDKAYSFNATSANASHFVLFDKEAILTQKILLDPLQEQREKRIALDKQRLTDKEVKEISGLESDQILQSGFINKLKKKLGKGFLNSELQQQWFGSLLLKKAPTLALFCLIASFLFSFMYVVRGWDLESKIAYYQEKEKTLIHEIAEKTGLSESDITTQPLLSVLYPNHKSVLDVFLATSDTLAGTASSTYQGKSLEINMQQFFLEGETRSFTEAEVLEKELAQSPNFKNVVTVRSEKMDNRVIFKIQADRVN